MKNQINKPFLIVLVSLVTFAYSGMSQNIAINATGNDPDASAMLDVQSSNKGMIVPQVSLLSLTDAATIASPAHSLLIYNPSASSISKGYYYNSGTTAAPVWVRLASSADLLTLSAIGTAPNANAATISGSILTLQPADASFGGVVSTVAQTFAGAKSFSGMVSFPSPFTLGATSVTSTGTQLNYLNAATGTTGTPSSSLVYSTSPLFTTPRLSSSSTSGYVWTATDANGNGSWQNVAGTVNAVAAIGAVPNANGASISGNALTLQPASASYGGVITTGTQTIAGNKTFSGSVTTGMLMPTGKLMLPMGEISYFNTAGTTVSITAVSNGTTNMVQATPVTTLVNYQDFDNGGSNNGILRYTGTIARDFHIACTVSFQPGGGSAATYVFGVAKNGVVITSSKVLQRLTNNSSDINSTALHVSVSLATNDTLSFYVGNLTSTGDIKMISINLFALGM